IWLCSRHFGSNACDLFGMRMYSHSAGMISPSQTRSDRASASLVLSLPSVVMGALLLDLPDDVPQASIGVRPCPIDDRIERRRLSLLASLELRERRAQLVDLSLRFGELHERIALLLAERAG